MKLKKGQEFKNWRCLCKYFKWKVYSSGSNSHKSQVKQLSSLCEYHKEGHKIIIDRVFDTPKSIKDNRIGRYSIETPQYKIDKYNNNNIGIYIIIDKHNNCYIGSTTRSFRYRFVQHWNNHEGTMEHTYELLHDYNADFKILYDMTGVDDVELIRMVEDEFIQYFRSLPLYNVLNRTKNAYYKGYNGKKKKYINVKVDEDKYSEIINLLQNNDLLEYCIVK